MGKQTSNNMKMSVLLSTALMLIGAGPGALYANALLRGVDTAAGVLDIVEPDDGPKYASGGPRAWLRESGQGNRDVNCNPCYCNESSSNSKKQCRDGYMCVKHKCLLPTDDKKDKNKYMCVEGSNGRTCCYKDDDCNGEGTCVNRMCEQKIAKRTTQMPSGKGGRCSDDIFVGPICETGLECIDGTCVNTDVREGGVCGEFDLCADGLNCVNGICTAPVQRRSGIGLGGTCDLSIGDTCAQGLECVNGICTQMLIPFGGACAAGDTCESPYVCVDGKCGNPLIPFGGACAAGDTCERPYVCINGRCGSSIVPYGGACGAGDTCASGLECLGGVCMDPITGTCTNGCICLNNDCAKCTTNCSCFGLCCMPRCLGSTCNQNGGSCPLESKDLQLISK